MKVHWIFLGFLLVLCSSVFALTTINSCTNLSTSGETYQLGSSFDGNVSNCLNITSATGITIDGQNNQITSTYYTTGLFGSSIYTNNVISANTSIAVLNFITGQYAEPVFAISNSSNFTNIIVRNIGHDNSSLANGGTYPQTGSEDAVMVFKSYFENNAYAQLPPTNATLFKLSTLQIVNMSLTNISISRDFGGGGTLYSMRTVMLFGAQSQLKPSIIDSNLVYNSISLENITFQNINASGKLFYFAQLRGNQTESTNATKFQVTNIQANNLNFINMNDNATGTSVNSFAKTSIIAAVSQFYPILIENVSITNVNFTNITNFNGFSLLNPAVFRYHYPLFGDNPGSGVIGTQLLVNNLSVENISSDSIPVIFSLSHPNFPGAIQNFTIQNIIFKQRKSFDTIAIYDFFGSGNPSQNTIKNYNFSVSYTNGQQLNAVFNITNDSTTFLVNDIKGSPGNLLGYNRTNTIDLNTTLNISWYHDPAVSVPTMDLVLSYPNLPTNIPETAIKIRRFIVGGTPTTEGSWVNIPDVSDDTYWQNVEIDTANNLFIVHNQTAISIGAISNNLYALQIEAVKVRLNSPGSGETAATSASNVTLNWTCYGAFPSYAANVTFDGVQVGINNISLNNTPQNLTVFASQGSHLWDVKCLNDTYYINSNQTFQITNVITGGGGEGGGSTPPAPTTTTPPATQPPVVAEWNKHVILDGILKSSNQVKSISFTCYPYVQNILPFVGVWIFDRLICELKGLLAIYFTSIGYLSTLLIILLILLGVYILFINKKKEGIFFWGAVVLMTVTIYFTLDMILFLATAFLTIGLLAGKEG